MRKRKAARKAAAAAAKAARDFRPTHMNEPRATVRHASRPRIFAKIEAAKAAGIDINTAIPGPGIIFAA